MFCVWQDNEHDWIKPAAGVGVSRGLFLTLSSSDSSLRISKQNLQKSQRPSATPREQKSLDNEENETWENFWPQVMFVCGEPGSAPRQIQIPNYSPVTVSGLSVSELTSVGEKSGQWWQLWRAMTPVNHTGGSHNAVGLSRISIEFGQHQTIVRFSYSWLTGELRQ